MMRNELNERDKNKPEIYGDAFMMVAMMMRFFEY